MTLARRLRVWRQRYRSLIAADTVDRELRQELDAHLDELTQELMAQGLPLEDARASARRSFGNSLLVEEQCRDTRQMGWFETVCEDVRWALRVLRRSPGFAAVAVLSLALASGAVIAVAAMIDTLVLGTLPLTDSDRLVMVRTVSPNDSGTTLSATWPEYLAWQDRTALFDAIGAALGQQHVFAADGERAPLERIAGQAVTPGWFDALGAASLLGRSLNESDFNSQAAVVLSHQLWQRRFAGDPDILGRRIRIDGADTEVVGVMPADFQYQSRQVEYWLPLGANRPPRNARFYLVTGRLRAGVTPALATTDLNRVTAALRNGPDAGAAPPVRVQPLKDALWGWIQRPLLTVAVAVTLMLTVACVNLGGLVRARRVARESEVAVRMALGAGRGRIIRQTFAESLLLSGAGGALGLGLASFILRAAGDILPPPGMPELPAIGLNPTLFAMALMTSALSGLAVGAGSVLPAGQRSTRGALVVAQSSVALTLLIGSGLLMHSFVRLITRDLNFEPRGLLTFQFQIPAQEYTRPIGTHRGFPYVQIDAPPAATLSRILDRLGDIPGATSVAGSSLPPVNSFVVPMVTAIRDDHAHDTTGPASLQTAHFLVTPRFFQTMKVSVRGREFDDGDVASAPWVAVVNEAAAAQLWPREDPIGRRLRLDIVPDEAWREIVGVVRNIPVRRGRAGDEPVIYTSYLQQPSRTRGPANLQGQMLFLLRTDGDPLQLVPAVRRAVADIDARRPLANMGPMSGYVDGRIREQRNYVLLLVVCALAATGLALTSIYGIVAYAVLSRAREIAIRKTVGAAWWQIADLMCRRMLGLIALGTIGGLATSLAITPLIADQLWETTPGDPVTFLVVSLLFVGMGLLTCAWALKRAMTIEPALLLKSE